MVMHVPDVLRGLAEPCKLPALFDAVTSVSIGGVIQIRTENVIVDELRRKILIFDF